MPSAKCPMSIDLNSIETFAFYLYNRTPIDVLRDIYGPDTHESYLAEKYTDLARGFHALWGRLDEHHKIRFVKAAQRFADSVAFSPDLGLQ